MLLFPCHTAQSNSNMKSSNNGIRLIQEFEGLRLTSYLCSAGVPTIGYGATYYHDGSKVKLGQTITNAQAAQPSRP